MRNRRAVGRKDKELPPACEECGICSDQPDAIATMTNGEKDALRKQREIMRRGCPDNPDKPVETPQRRSILGHIQDQEKERKRRRHGH